jgi:quercetin dioxygenase-like cupin family protein
MSYITNKRQAIRYLSLKNNEPNLIVHMDYVIEGIGALVNEKGEETPVKAGDFALVNPDEKHQYRNKGDVPFKMICGVPKEFE